MYDKTSDLQHVQEMNTREQAAFHWYGYVPPDRLCMGIMGTTGLIGSIACCAAMNIQEEMWYGHGHTSRTGCYGPV